MEYNQAEAQFKVLKEQFAAGKLDEAAFKAKLNELMVQDGQGSWWMIGYETGQWYKHDGSAWVQADPPGRVPPKPAQQEKVMTDAFTAKPAAEAKKSSSGPAAPPSSAGGKTAPEIPAPAKVVKKMGWGFWLGWIGGIAAGVAVLILLILIDGSSEMAVPWTLISGGVTGVLQWLILRQYFPKTWWWIPANAIYLGVTIAIGMSGSTSFTYFLLFAYAVTNIIVMPVMISRKRWSI